MIQKDRARALALYKKALTTKQGLVAAEPTNAEFQRLVAYDHFAMAELLAGMGKKALPSRRIAKLWQLSETGGNATLRMPSFSRISDECAGRLARC